MEYAQRRDTGTIRVEYDSSMTPPKQPD